MSGVNVDIYRQRRQRIFSVLVKVVVAVVVSFFPCLCLNLVQPLIIIIIVSLTVHIYRPTIEGLAALGALHAYTHAHTRRTRTPIRTNAYECVGAQTRGRIRTIINVHCTPVADWLVAYTDRTTLIETRRCDMNVHDTEYHSRP